jgi:hypothetical protein
MSAFLNTFFLSGLINYAIIERFNDSLISELLIYKLDAKSLFNQFLSKEMILSNTTISCGRTP